MDADQGQVTVRAAVHAVDAALAEHRRALALAAGRRERERMARGREVKAAAAASAEALEQPVERPLRTVRLAETWIEVDRARHQLSGSVRATVEEAELRVRGDGWSARVALAPGDAPATAAREAAERIEAAAAAVTRRAAARLERVGEAGRRHAAACHAAAAALAAADRELLERHADHARVESCATELAERLGPRVPAEPAEVAAARDRLEHARAHLATAPEQPYEWIADVDPAVAGAMLRDLREETLDAARPAVAQLAREARGPLLALATGADAVVAAAGEHALVATGTAVERYEAVRVAVAEVALAVAGREVVGDLAEAQPGRLAAVLDLVRASSGVVPPPAPDDREDPVELLHRLGDLRDRGVITAAEFAAKKAELLRRI